MAEQVVWLAYSAGNDDENDPVPDDLGVYSSEVRAREIVTSLRPRTGSVERVVVDEVPEWVADRLRNADV